MKKKFNGVEKIEKNKKKKRRDRNIQLVPIGNRPTMFVGNYY